MNPIEQAMIEAIEQAREQYEAAVTQLARWRMSNAEPQRFRSVYETRGAHSFDEQSCREAVEARIPPPLPRPA